MRTAEEIIKNVFDNSDPKSAISELYIIAINEARKEAIIECASIGEKNNTYYGCYKDGSRRWITDKKSILSLIDELK